MADVRGFVRQHLNVIAYLVLVIALLVNIWRVERVARETARTANENLKTLCNFRADIGRRYDATAEFVAELRAGKREPIPGISIVDLERSRDNLRMTLDSLSGLDCR